MKKTIFLLFIIILSIFLVGCGRQVSEKSPEIETPSYEGKNIVKMYIDEKEYIIVLEENETVTSFLNLLPKEFTLRDSSGTNKYVSLEEELPQNPIAPKHISAGDIMLSTDNQFIIFYRSLDTKETYTKIGHIDRFPVIEGKRVVAYFEK